VRAATGPFVTFGRAGRPRSAPGAAGPRGGRRQARPSKNVKRPGARQAFGRATVRYPVRGPQAAPGRCRGKLVVSRARDAQNRMTCVPGQVPLAIFDRS
jgi:hypothetical protein